MKCRQQKPRQSNIELLRIIAMLIIVAHHFAVHSGFEFSYDTVTVNRLWVQFIRIGGKIGVNVFVLISGYFLITAKTLKTSKALKLWIQIFSYSVIIFAVFILSGIRPFGIKELIRHCFPVSSSRWWFASTYFILYLISPFLNVLLNSFDRKIFQRFLTLLTFCWCIVPTLSGKLLESNNLLWFIYLYSLAGYIRLCGVKTNIKGRTYILLSFVLTILTWLSAVVFGILETKYSIIGDYDKSFYGAQCLPILIISLLLFVGFAKIEIGYKRLINVISSATFGVYLIHDNEYVRPFLWKTVFKVATYSDSSLLIPYSLFVIAIVFVSCTLIELARIHIFEKHYMGAVNALAGKIDKIKERIFSHSFFSKI